VLVQHQVWKQVENMILEINTKTLDQKFCSIQHIFTKYSWVPKKIPLSSLTCSQIWLNPLVDDGQVHVSHKLTRKPWNSAHIDCRENECHCWVMDAVGSGK